MDQVSYRLQPSKRSILAEIYFPKKAAYQGAIYEALKLGLNEDVVKTELVKNIQSLYETEFALSSPHRFDPNRYTVSSPIKTRPTQEEARRRMEMYSSPFFGWSMYEVDGVFLNSREDGTQHIDEERVQVIRLMFKFEQQEIEARAQMSQCYDVYRAMIYWAMSAYGHVDNYFLWSDDERGRFLDRHTWTGEEREFAERHFRTIVSALGKWMDDIALFIFGYLVRRFWLNVADLQRTEGMKLEDEIWVASIFHLNINVVHPIKDA